MALIPNLGLGKSIYLTQNVVLERLFSQSTGDLSALLANLSFLLLFLAMSLYWISLAFFKTKKVSKALDKALVFDEAKPEFLRSASVSLGSLQPMAQSADMSLANFGRLAIYGSNVSLFLLLCVRWQESGHFPLSNLYESLMFLSWSCTSIHIFLINSKNLKPNMPLGSVSSGWGTFLNSEAKLRLKQSKALPENVFTNLLLGSVLAPSALFLNAFATFSLPKEMQQAGPLVPALQSNWLMMHVTVMIISYSALMLGSLLAIAYLIFTKVSDLKLVGVREASKNNLPRLDQMLTQPGEKLNTGKVDQTLDNQTLQTNSSFLSASSPMSADNTINYVGNKTLSWPEDSNMDSTLSFPNRTFNQNSSVDDQNSNKNRRANKLDKTKLFASFEVKSLTDNLDYLSYRIIGIGFPFLTIGILSGAVWANEAWGSYWSWDPKETWALLTWFVFAIYLHTRLQKGWEGDKPALLASLGFIVVWICYLGVNLLGEGLHSYGFLT